LAVAPVRDPSSASATPSTNSNATTCVKVESTGLGSGSGLYMACRGGKVTSAFSADSVKVVHISAGFQAAEASSGSAYNQYHAALQSQMEQGIEKKLFDEMYAYDTFPSFLLPSATSDKFKQHVSAGANDGVGYWFWKPLLVQHHLDLLKDGDILMYSDAGLTAFWDFLPNIFRVMTERNDNFLLWMQRKYTEQQSTKRDVYEAYCGSAKRDLQTDYSVHMKASTMVFRNDAATRQLVQQLIVAVSNYHAVSDEESYLPDYPFFSKRHQHDQSLLNMLLKCRYDFVKPPRQKPLGNPSPTQDIVRGAHHIMFTKRFSFRAFQVPLLPVEEVTRQEEDVEKIFQQFRQQREAGQPVLQRQ
jgi:hypothetical protein